MVTTSQKEFQRVKVIENAAGRAADYDIFSIATAQSG
jgi:hypothetical protein